MSNLKEIRMSNTISDAEWKRLQKQAFKNNPERAKAIPSTREQARIAREYAKNHKNPERS